MFSNRKLRHRLLPSALSTKGTTNLTLYHILTASDCIDCSSSNVLYLASCTLCPDNLQYGGAARDLSRHILDMKVLL